MGLFGGDSSSSTSNLYETNTQTLSANEGGQLTANNIKATDSTVMVTDGGAVKNALDFANAASRQITAAGQSMYEGALATVSDQNKLLADAYQQGQAGDQTQLKYAGFAVVGLAVVAAAAFAIKAR